MTIKINFNFCLKVELTSLLALSRWNFSRPLVNFATKAFEELIPIWSR